MEIKTKRHKEIFEDFAKRHPNWAKDVVECVPKHLNAIRVTYSDGGRMDYNGATHTYRDVPEYYCSSPDDVQDDVIRETFAGNLAEIMRMKGFDQVDLAERTGLTTAAISKYLRKKATPSITSLEKIAYALNCSRDELLD